MATYYVDGAVGDNGNAGTSEGSGNAWATITYGSNQLASGDTLYVKASVTYTAEYFLPAAAGAAESPISCIGYSSTPGDGGVVSMDGNSSATYGCLNASSYAMWRIENFSLYDYTQYGFYGPNADNWGWVNVTVDNCAFGFYFDDYCSMDNCVVKNCTNRGVQIDQYTVLHNSQFLDNGGTSHNVWLRDNFCRVTNCVFAGNAGTCLYINALGCIMNCVFDGQNTVEGLRFASNTYATMLVNNVFYDCTTALNAATSTYYYPKIVARNNLFYSNTTDYTSEWPASAKAYDITGSDPDFADPSTYDYTITSSSPCYQAGYPANMHIGVSHPADPAAGGRVVLIG